MCMTIFCLKAEQKHICKQSLYVEKIYIELLYKLEVRINFECKKGVGIAIKSKETSSWLVI